MEPQSESGSAQLGGRGAGQEREGGRGEEIERAGAGLGVRQAWVQIPALPPPSTVTLSTGPHASGSSQVHGAKNTASSWGGWAFQ